MKQSLKNNYERIKKQDLNTIDPMLKAGGWGEVDGSKTKRELRITDGRIEPGDEDIVPGGFAKNFRQEIYL